MSKNTAIEIFLRVRPTKKAYGGMNIVNEDNKIEFFIPKKDKSGYVNNSKENHKFAFDGLLPMPTKQEEVFDHVAKDVVDSALEGFNGTIFAYGQTGSGKTFTMTGGAEKYSDREKELTTSTRSVFLTLKSIITMVTIYLMKITIPKILRIYPK
jgi:kinesin family protein 6/9